ncbi:hypothetical protein [Curtobacterium sp. VKM Ac-2922]|uniref:hypothetical protein n=1 Tax=Curtobacterium sp. VKM Ac-2922 TaxID=2929475 RepID=UPI001FB45C97|nr:hypothetical protein [Curtobacterium sp. VKM Ac-2922]MCJ1715740.1 hypothetical protein [Curtobacterium sp. VKM Ac-2922]
MTRSHDYRELVRRVPLIRSLLAASFNYDWMLDHPTAESVYDDVFSGISEAERKEYLEQATVLQEHLRDDDAVAGFLSYVHTGLVPQLDFGLTPKSWLDALIGRLEDLSG